MQLANESSTRLILESKHMRFVRYDFSQPLNFLEHTQKTSRLISPISRLQTLNQSIGYIGI